MRQEEGEKGRARRTLIKAEQLKKYSNNAPVGVAGTRVEKTPVKASDGTGGCVIVRAPAAVDVRRGSAEGEVEVEAEEDVAAEIRADLTCTAARGSRG